MLVAKPYLFAACDRGFVICRVHREWPRDPLALLDPNGLKWDRKLMETVKGLLPVPKIYLLPESPQSPKARFKTSK